MKTLKISHCALFQNRKMTFHGLTENHTSMSGHFLHSGNCSSLTRNNSYFEILYQKKTRRMKVAEEPQQNLTITYLLFTHASKTSSRHSSAQDACHRLKGWFASCSGRTAVIFSYSPKHCLQTGSSLVRTHIPQVAKLWSLLLHFAK